MSQGTVYNETICDRLGEPLRPKSARLLKALDKLLTVGAYYSAEHAQYLQAARKARDEIVGAIGGPERQLAIEITAQGLLVGGQNLDPHHRNVHLLHELLVPLNIARLEIDGTLSPEDLRQALAALHHHKSILGQTNTFQEIVIEDLPATVRAISCSVLRRADAEEVGGGSDFSLDDLLGDDGGDQPAVADSAQLTQRFLDLVTQIMANLEALGNGGGIPLGEGPDRAYVTVADLIALKRALENLVTVNPDPAELAELIVQAQRALDLSRDKKSVELVFQILKKDLTEKSRPQPGPMKAATTEPAFRLTVAQLLAEVSELAASPATVPEPWAGSRTNQLGIALHLLRSDPPRALRGALLSTIEELVVRSDFAGQNLTLYAQVAATVVRDDDSEAIDELLALMAGILRQKAPRLVAPFWTALLAAARPDKLPALWPHLVNDILLGLHGAPRDQALPLITRAGSLTVMAARAQVHRLEKLPALQGHGAARDLFQAPLSATFSILVCLLTSPLQIWLGAELFQTLRRRPTSPLVDLVMTALGEHDPLQSELYLELIQHGQDPEPPASLREPATALLLGRLENLPSGSRGQDWVPLALQQLSRLAPAESQPLLTRVCQERRYLFFRAWPPAARAAAASAATENAPTSGEREVL